MALARSIEELRRLAGGRSVYSEQQLVQWQASPERPVKVINFLLAGHISPPMSLARMHVSGVVVGHPPNRSFNFLGLVCCQFSVVPILASKPEMLVVALVGLSGVGKSTFLERLRVASRFAIFRRATLSRQTALDLHRAKPHRKSYV